MPVVIGETSVERANLALAGETADIIYSDPPWGPGNLKYWATYNGHELEDTWPNFVQTIAKICQASLKPGGHLFLEFGVRWADEQAKVMAEYGFPEVARWECFYGNPKRPNVLWYSGPGVEGLDPSGLSGVKMTQTVMDAVAEPGALVFDMCCGKGMTARTAVRAGMRFAGVEMNPKRAQVTIDWLTKKGLPV